MIQTSLTFSPLLPPLALWGLAGLGAVLLAALAWRKGALLPRGLALLLLLAALLNPQIQQAERAALGDIWLVLEDRTASQSLSTRAGQSGATRAEQSGAIRAEQTDLALAALKAAAQAQQAELRVVTVEDGPNNSGTALGRALEQALAREPAARLAGVFLLTDGRLHDLGALQTAAPAPMHLLLTGNKADHDRRLVLANAPAFGIIGETITLGLRVEDEGEAAPEAEAELSIAVDGAEPFVTMVPLGQDLDLPITLEHAGQNVVQITVAPRAGELTPRNNAASVQINGLRDRLKVLLVSGEPHPGERTWRNLLKSDAGIDLVHFTILRPPEKQDGTPMEELALIAFPTQELFEEKIKAFDLIIFDRYAERGILPPEYFENIRGFVEQGGALLVASGPEFAGVESVYHTPLGAILPAEPTGRVLEQAYLPRPTAEGLRHPVLAGLKGMPPVAGEAPEHWGRWLRQVEITPRAGVTVLAGAEGKPLLQLNRVGEGRVALLASDQAWLWDRGFEGGGPQLELLRRIAHWSMREPELEEEALTAAPLRGEAAFTITRRSMAESLPAPVEITAPDGTRQSVTLAPDGAGQFSAKVAAAQEGLYRLKQDAFAPVVAMGPASPREFEEVIASAALLAAPVAASGGGVYRLEEGMPAIRALPAGGVLSGKTWAGVTPRAASRVTGVSAAAALPAWGWLLLAALAMIWAWGREGGRFRRA